MNRYILLAVLVFSSLSTACKTVTTRDPSYEPPLWGEGDSTVDNQDYAGE